jgi:hypothetical protein
MKLYFFRHSLVKNRGAARRDRVSPRKDPGDFGAEANIRRRTCDTPLKGVPPLRRRAPHHSARGQSSPRLETVGGGDQLFEIVAMKKKWPRVAVRRPAIEGGDPDPKPPWRRRFYKRPIASGLREGDDFGLCCLDRLCTVRTIDRR